jgi:long-chain fatty acid transport protein
MGLGQGGVVTSMANAGTSHHRIQTTAMTAAFAALVFSTGAHAAGFSLREQSASAQGNAFAGATAAAEDVSYMFFNPATLGLLDGYQALAVVNYIRPQAELSGASGTTALGSPIGGRTSAGDVTDDVVTPALYGMAELPLGLRAGVGVNVPFGLQVGYPGDWVGRYHVVSSELQTVNINPALAWRPLDWLSVGAGLQVQYADAEVNSAVDFGTIGAAAGIPGAVPAGQDGFARLKGDDWAVGFNLGAILEPAKGTRIGFAYRSELEHELEGDARFDLDQAGIGAALRAATGAFANTGASTKITTPAMLSAGIRQELTSQWAVMGEVAWTEWSAFEELRIRFDNPAQPDNLTEEDWRDTFFVALGTTYKPTEEVTLRGGIAFDQTPVEDEHRTPLIPDADRYWLSFGVGWQPLHWLGIDAGYTHIFVDDADVDLSATDPGSTFRGSLDASYETRIDIFTVSGKISF